MSASRSIRRRSRRSSADNGGGPVVHPRLADTRGDSVAVLGHFACAFGRETSKTVLANVARAWRGEREGRSRSALTSDRSRRGAEDGNLLLPESVG
jgi:hypothetical protein